MIDQDLIFREGEANAWFHRNQAALGRPDLAETDPALQMLSDYEVRPARVLEVGCSNGWRLDLLRRRFGCRCVGVEPSPDAIADARARHPGVELRRGVASRLPCPEGEQFDLVLFCFVLHWIDRRSLLMTVAEADRVLGDGGSLLLHDFLPDAPCRNRYHHRSDVELYTYKQDYAAMFQATALYTEVARLTYAHGGGRSLRIAQDDRTACVLLRKSLDQFYPVRSAARGTD